MRSKEVTVGQKPYMIMERKISDLRLEVIPKLLPLWEVFKGTSTVEEALGKLPEVEIALCTLFPGLTPERLEESYPSELEDLVMGAIEVNFFGLKRLFGQVFSLNLERLSKS